MGATNFITTGLGATAKDAFIAARDNALWESGHGGYTGTIAEKDDFILAELPPRWTVDKFVAAMLHQPSMPKPKRDSRGSWALKNWNQERKAYDELLAIVGGRKVDQWRIAYNEKWGPCVAVEVTGAAAVKIKQERGRKGTRDKVFTFCGFASM